MNWYKTTLEISTGSKGLYPITSEIQNQLRGWGVREGMCYLFLPHASASLVISESYDPSARQDIEEYFERLVPENQPWMTHTLEGSDDSSSHIRATLTRVDLTIPIEGGQLALGTWQGVFVFEHRRGRRKRRVYLRCLEMSD